MSYIKIITIIISLIVNVCTGFILRPYFASIIYDYFAIWSFIIAIICSIINIYIDDGTYKNIIIFNVSTILNCPANIYMLYIIHNYMNSYFMDFIIILFIIFYIIGVFIINKSLKNQYLEIQEFERIQRNRILLELNEKILKTEEIEKY